MTEHYSEGVGMVSLDFYRIYYKHLLRVQLDDFYIFLHYIQIQVLQV